MFIKTAVTGLASDGCLVTFANNDDIVEVKKSVNRYNVGLTGLFIAFIIELIYFSVKKPQIVVEDYDNQNVYKTCFHKSCFF